ncbi:MAG: molecular chaperone HtpG [Rhabdochlamydiaceae bacterium]
MLKKNLKIHTENILPIIKKWLYSDKEIFLRELVSNACDALNKLKILRDHQEVDAQDDQMQITITLDKEKKTLKITDTGIGMTSEEVEKYIAQIAFSGAEEFLGKYQSQNEKEAIIGHFGLGFYSAYMVSEKVEINTLSYKTDSQAVFWSCDGSSSYEISEGQKQERGTEITLFISQDSEEFLEADKLKTILTTYCAFLPFPIFFNGERINDKDPLWLKPASECTDKEYIDFYHSLYPFEGDPVFWIHLNVDYPFNLKGILYFPKITKKFEWNKSHIKLFCNRVFVSDNCKDLIPDFLMVLKGSIDSPDIPLNVSRSYLQMDKTVRQLSSHISKKVVDRLSSLYNLDRDKFISSWPDIEIIIKLGCLQDEKFYEKAKNFLVWKNLKEEWTLIEDYLQRNESRHKNKVFYTTEDKDGSFSLSLYKEKDIEVLYASSYLDSALISHLERKLSVTFQRVDGAIDDAILDTSKEDTLLDEEGKTKGTKIADTIKKHLGSETIQVEAKSLSSENVPAFIVVDEQVRRIREYMLLSQQSLPDELMKKSTFVVNTNNKLIQKIYEIEEKDPSLAKEVVEYLYGLSQLSQKELDPKDLPSFVQKSHKILEHLLLS